MEQILETEFVSSDYRIRLKKVNKIRIPQIVETKHILIPANNHFGDGIMVPIIQEHALGTKKYTLKRGETRKQTVSVLATSQA